MGFFSFDYAKGYIQDVNLAGTFLLPLGNFCYHHFTEHGDIAYFAYMVTPHGYHTSGVTSLFEHI